MPLVQRINGGLRRFPVWPVYIVGITPALWLFFLGLSGGLGPDPVKALEHQYGKFALQLLVAVLAVTPLRRLTGISLLRFRRAIGLLAFYYVCLHFLVWLGLDIQFMWGEVWTDIAERPYITIGMAGFAMLVPLALTSTDRMIRHMGPVAWKRLHRLTYLVAVAGAIHFILLVKAWPMEPFIYLGIILGLIALRRRARAAQPARG